MSVRSSVRLSARLCPFCVVNGQDACEVPDSEGFFCTRPPQHPGFHVACSDSTHEIAQWAPEVTHEDFALIKVGSVPPWMEETDVRLAEDDLSSGRETFIVTRRMAQSVHERSFPTYRLSPTPDPKP